LRLSQRRILLVLSLFTLVAIASIVAYRYRTLADRVSSRNSPTEADIALLSVLRSEQVLAKVGDVSIRGTDVRDALQTEFHGQQRHASLSRQDLALKISTALEGVLEDELLSQEARLRGFTSAFTGSQARKDLANQLFNTESAKLPPVTDQDMRTFYKNHGEKFYIPPGTNVKELFLPANSLAEEKTIRKEAIEKAMVLVKDLAGRIRNGERIEDLAKVHTPEAFQDRAKGFLFKGGMVDAKDEQAILHLRPGEVYGPVRVEGGVSVFQGISQERARFIPFFLAQEKIRTFLEFVRKQELRIMLVERAKQRVVVQRFNPDPTAVASGKS
jgi:hypothetical protein